MTAAFSDRRPEVSFVLPAYNEETNITNALEQTVRAARRFCSTFEILVVDDGSTDLTAELVQRARAQEPAIKLVSHGVNRGYGEALRSGFAAARLEWIFFTDADNQFDMSEIQLLMAWADRADVVAGYRRVRQDPLIRKLNAWGWNRIVRWLFYVPVRDIDCAFKLFRRRALQAIDIESRGAMINTEIMVKLARRGCTVVEVGVSHYPRTAGAPNGANVRVIARAFREVKKMYPHLTALAPSQPDEGADTDRDTVPQAHNGHDTASPPVHVAANSEDRRAVGLEAKPEPLVHSVMAGISANGSNGGLDETRGNGTVGVGAHEDVAAESR